MTGDLIISNYTNLRSIACYGNEETGSLMGISSLIISNNPLLTAITAGNHTFADLNYINLTSVII